MPGSAPTPPYRLNVWFDLDYPTSAFLVAAASACWARCRAVRGSQVHRVISAAAVEWDDVVGLVGAAMAAQPTHVGRGKNGCAAEFVLSGVTTFPGCRPVTQPFAVAVARSGTGAVCPTST